MSLSNGEVLIAPSLAAGDLLNLGAEIKRLEECGADMLHVDVMDGHFVPLLTLGVPFVEAIHRITSLPLDVHIMVTNPEAVAGDYLDAGADILTFHVEAALHAPRLCSTIRSRGKKAGIALNPATPVNCLDYLLPYVDQITIMTVNPGFSRQAHMNHLHDKIISIKKMIEGLPITIEVDGGVNVQNAPDLRAAGATVLVAGGAIMGQSDYRKAMDALR